MSNAEKLKALKLTMDKIDKDFGKGSVMIMGDKPHVEQEVISTGSLGLDVALGIGGLPKGREGRVVARKDGRKRRFMELGLLGRVSGF